MFGAVIVFTIASLTDFYDGHLAKKKGLVSNFGKIMDPIADKVLILSTFGVLAHLGMIACWMFIVIAVREVAVTASRILWPCVGDRYWLQSAPVRSRQWCRSWLS